MNSPDEKWELQKIKLKEAFPHLDADDLKFDYGMKDSMMDKLQVKLGRSREELNKLLAIM